MTITLEKSEVSNLKAKNLMSDAIYIYMALRSQRGENVIQSVDALSLQSEWGITGGQLLTEVFRLLDARIITKILLDQFRVNWINASTALTPENRAELRSARLQKLLSDASYVHYILRLSGATGQTVISAQLTNTWEIDQPTLVTSLRSLIAAKRIEISLEKLSIAWGEVPLTYSYSELEQENWIADTRDRWGETIYRQLVDRVVNNAGETTVMFKNGNTITARQTWSINWGQVDAIAGIDQLPPPPPTVQAADDPWIRETRARWVNNHGEQLVSQKITKIDYVDEAATFFFSNGKTMKQDESWSMNWGEQEAFAGLI